MGFGAGIFTYDAGDGCRSAGLSESVDCGAFSLTVKRAKRFGGMRLTAILTPRRKLTVLDAYVTTDERLEPESRFFLNGWQTWTDSREVGIDASVPRLNPLLRPLMGMYGDYGFRRGGRGVLVSWTYTYLRRAGGKITFYGSLAEKSGYTSFEYSKREKTLTVRKDCGGFEPPVGEPYVLLDVFTTESEDNEAFDAYFAAMGIPVPRVPASTGWTSWYNYYTGVTEQDVLKNLAAFREKKLPIDIFQIDDGYQQAVGDWLAVNGKFPHGMAALARQIKADGRKAGLWLAPFICEKKSALYREHPEWAVARAGYNPGWSGVFYALDLYHPAVREYLRGVFRTVLDDWGFDLVKLDFLYAATLLPRRDKTRGQMMHDGMRFLRELAGDRLILGCGVPLGSAFGLTDFCRVSSDVALAWEDPFLARMHYRERTSTLNALTSTIGRWQLNGRAFRSDPDVFILRDGGNRLTADQKDTLFLVNTALGGLAFTSDNVAEYDGRKAGLYGMLFGGSGKQVSRVATGSGPVMIHYGEGARNRCLAANLAGGPAAAKAPFAGMLRTGDDGFTAGRAVAEGESVALRPYQTVCFLENQEGESL